VKLKDYPAVEIRAAVTDLLLAVLDDFAPVAIEEHDQAFRVFFATAEARDAALGAVSGDVDARSLDVSDQDWARRSQENLQPVTVGRITIAPTPSLESRASNLEPPAPSPQALFIVIEPSMGFGTGHHPTTRLCLAALQDLELSARTVLDVGTGSGVLAIAAARLGAAQAVGVDIDADALQSARENLTLNPDARHVTFQLADLSDNGLAGADIVTANLTGALLVRAAARLRALTQPGGVLVLSGLMTSERDEVCRAFDPAAVVWERREDEWVGLAMKNP
jgi:ribosomal protein L11 methyltransferase